MANSAITRGGSTASPALRQLVDGLGRTALFVLMFVLVVSLGSLFG